MLAALAFSRLELELDRDHRRQLLASDSADSVAKVDQRLERRSTDERTRERSLFADDPSVFTFSIQNDHWGPTDALASAAIALGAGVEDAEYLASLRAHLPAMLDHQRPRLVFYLAGCDPAAEDPLGNWRISAAGMLARDRYVLEQLRARGIGSVVWLLGGGYGSDAWRHSARALIAALGGPDAPGASPDPPRRADHPRAPLLGEHDDARVRAGPRAPTQHRQVAAATGAGAGQAEDGGDRRVPGLANSTISGFERWAEALRDRMLSDAPR